MELLTTSWPFDSDPNVTYDDLGYPILDRAVGADTMQRTFAQYFSNGVFRTPSDAFRISAGSGLTVNVQPGMAIINGGMAGWWDEAKAVTLSATAPQWLTHYAVFLRYDNNDDMRGIYLRVDASAAGGSVPAPVSAANVTELRIGYVTVPANATDLSSATIVNEVGTSMAPITVPLFDIDVTAVLEDLRAKADEAYQMYYDLLISAVDDTTAGLLQEQINAQDNRIATLEENQFTQDDIDPLALREQMGLGASGGVLDIPYGGTGVSSKNDLLSLTSPLTKATVSWSASEATVTVPSGLSLSDFKLFVLVAAKTNTNANLGIGPVFSLIPSSSLPSFSTFYPSRTDTGTSYIGEAVVDYISGTSFSITTNYLHLASATDATHHVYLIR